MLPIAILAGGLGTRLWPATRTVPKALVPVRGRPFIDHQLQLLRSTGISRAVICVGHLGEMIEQHVGNGADFGVEVSYSYDGEHLIGTAGALKRALPLLGSAFFTIYGDSFLQCDFPSVEATFLASGKSALMTVYHNSGALAPSNVLFRDGTIVAYDKRKPQAEMHHIDFGLSVFRQRAFTDVPLDRPTDLATVFEGLIVRGDLAGYESHNRFYEVGTPAGIAETEQLIASLADGSV